MRRNRETCRMHRWMRGRWCLAVLLLLACATAQGAEPFGGLLGPNLQVQGVMDIRREQGIVVVREYPTVTMDDRRIRARNIIFFETGHIYAEGDVVVEDSSGTTLRADRLYLDFKTWAGRAYEMELHSSQEPLKTDNRIRGVDVTLYSPRYALQGNDVLSEFGADDQQPIRINLFANDARMISKDHMEATHTWASPSNFAEPHWRFTSRAVNVRPDEKVEAYHNVLKIGKVPVFYFPYLIYDLKYNWPWVQVQGGYDSRNFGVYTYLKWGWDVDNVDEKWFEPEYFFWDTDYRQNRGFAFGSTVYYRTGKPGGPSGGRFHGYLIPTEHFMTGAEDRDRARDSSMVEYPATTTNLARSGYREPLYRNKMRFRLDWDHYQKLTDHLDFRAFAHFYSDRDVLKEYAPLEWEQDNKKLTNLSLRWLDDLFVAEVVAQKRLHTFRSEAEYLPEFRLRVPGAKLFQTPLYLENDFRAGLVHFEADRMLDDLGLMTRDRRLGHNGKSNYIARIHNESRLSLPVDLRGATLTPYVEGRSTFYSDTYDGNWGGDGANMNAALVWGADLSTRLYGLYRNETIRHLVEPKLSFIAQEAPRLTTDRLFKIDAIDEYRRSHTLVFRLHQAIDVKDEEGQARRFLDTNLRMGAILDNRESNLYNNNKRLTDIEADMSIYPTRNLTLSGDLTYSPAEQAFTRISGGIDWKYQDRIRAYLGHTYRIGSGINYDSQITSFAVRTQLWDEHSPYAIEYGISHQWSGSRSGSIFAFSDGVPYGGVRHGVQQQRVALIRCLDTFELKVSVAKNYTLRRSSGGFNNWEVMVQLSPKGWVGKRDETAGLPGFAQRMEARYDTRMAEHGEGGRVIEEDYWSDETFQLDW